MRNARNSVGGGGGYGGDNFPRQQIGVPDRDVRHAKNVNTELRYKSKVFPI
jgi:hypothetical protein